MLVKDPAEGHTGNPERLRHITHRHIKFEHDIFTENLPWMNRLLHVTISSVVVQIVNEFHVFAYKSKRHAPVPIDPDRPMTCALPTQLMGPKAWNLKISRSVRDVKDAEHATQLRHMACLQSRLRVPSIQSLETLMTETHDHTLSVLRLDTLYKTAKLRTDG
jgi:hypothetical protein